MMRRIIAGSQADYGEAAFVAVPRTDFQHGPVQVAGGCAVVRGFRDTTALAGR